MHWATLGVFAGVVITVTLVVGRDQPTTVDRAGSPAHSRAVASVAEHADPVLAQSGAAVTDSPSRIERTRFHSVALGRDMPITVYLPPGYESAAAAPYPVLYMLHGTGGHNTEWEAYGLLDAADRLIRSEKLSL
jgi:enterochelin esterase-like enzyme